MGALLSWAESGPRLETGNKNLGIFEGKCWWWCWELSVYTEINPKSRDWYFCSPGSLGQREAPIFPARRTKTFLGLKWGQPEGLGAHTDIIYTHPGLHFPLKHSFEAGIGCPRNTQPDELKTELWLCWVEYFLPESRERCSALNNVKSKFCYLFMLPYKALESSVVLWVVSLIPSVLIGVCLVGIVGHQQQHSPSQWVGQGWFLQGLIPPGRCFTHGLTLPWLCLWGPDNPK